MPRILVPVDGSENALRAIRHVLKNMAVSDPLELHILNVQPGIISGAVRAFIDKGTIDRYHEEEGTKALLKARELLDQAGTPYEAHIRVGHAGATIAAFSKEKHCDQIVMGTRGLGASSGLWLGSVTTKTLHLVEIPVTVVK